MSVPGFVPMRQLVLVDLLAMMVAVRPGERAVVAVDGVDGAGKSHLVGELLALAPLVAGREVVAVSVDGFHRPRKDRYAEGRGPEGYYRNSFDYDALTTQVLRPFRAGLEFTPAVHDVATDAPVHPDPVETDDDAVLLVEGIFLRRPELIARWDATLFVSCPFEISVPRGRRRDAAGAPPPGGPIAPSPDVVDPGHPGHPANARYVGGQRLYLQQSRLHPPTWILDNSDLMRPLLIAPDPEAPQWFEGADDDTPR